MSEKLKLHPGKVAKNIVKRYGYDKFVLLVNHLQKGSSGPVIAEEFGVTRQRVNQWKKTLGTEHYSYSLDPEVQIEVDKGSTGRMRETI